MSRVRIVGGTWRGRQVEVAPIPGLRPTPDRVRETLFNWLGQRLDGWRCLDLFAGTGVLGLEAASRGAAEVVLVESDPRASRLIRDKITGLPAPQVQLVRDDALRFLKRPQPAFDLIFLDPPYHHGWLDRVVAMLPAVSHAGTVVYAEAERALDALGPWRTVKRGSAGQVHFQLMSQPEADPVDPAGPTALDANTDNNTDPETGSDTS